MTFDEFKNKICQFKNYSSEDIELIKKAFLFGKKAFEGIKRKNGEPYFNHCLRTSLNLAELKLDFKMIIAGILHDILEDTPITEDELKKDFGEEITFLVKGVTYIGNIHYKKKDLEQADKLRKLIVSLTEDLRIAILKLADRLDNMRTLSFLPREKQKKIAMETQDIYAPLALRLGISSWAGELDDLAFKFLEPEKYQEINNLIKHKFKNGEKILKKIKFDLMQHLRKNNINFIEIQSRIKTPSSIFKKLKRKNFDLDQIYDILAIRIIVNTIEECYLTLGVIHSLYKPIMEEFNDYISHPKPNGYQSLHTTCLVHRETYVEFQIRTKEMHIRNEEGIAAYFAYADSKQTKKYQKEKPTIISEKELKIINELKKWKENILNQEEIIKALKTDFLKEEIYVFTPQGDIIKLPTGSTPLDFAYKIHTEIGNSYAGAKVNNKIVPITYELKSGDIVEIIRNKNKKPSIDWLQIVKTYEAKKRIKSFLKKLHPAFFQKSYSCQIWAKDRIGLLKDITNIISSQGINIIGLKSKVKKEKTFIYLEVKLTNKEELAKLKDNLKKRIPEIIEIK